MSVELPQLPNLLSYSPLSAFLKKSNKNSMCAALQHRNLSVSFAAPAMLSASALSMSSTSGEDIFLVSGSFAVTCI
jgi:hypothetical protein